MQKVNYLSIVKHYEDCFEIHGDNHLGVDWPDQESAQKRYQVMLDVLKEKPGKVKVLDFGCGAGHLYKYILQHKLSNRINYVGLDASSKFVTFCKEKYPATEFICVDILKDDIQLNDIDYVILNGVFTEKLSMTQSEMLEYFMKVIVKLYPIAQQAVAFNVMSKHVDWERDDLFHLSFDELASFITKEITRNFVIRQDYGLYEYTTYLYRTV